MKRKYDLIFITGAPGSGKTTLAKMLRDTLEVPMVDLGWLRQYHLDKLWKKASPREAKMSFENLTFILKNYKKNGYKNVIITDLLEEMTNQIPKLFSKERYIIISLIVKEDSELKRRVLGERDSGFKDFKKAIQVKRTLQN